MEGSHLVCDQCKNPITEANPTFCPHCGHRLRKLQSQGAEETHDPGPLIDPTPGVTNINQNVPAAPQYGQGDGMNPPYHAPQPNPGQGVPDPSLLGQPMMSMIQQMPAEQLQVMLIQLMQSMAGQIGQVPGGQMPQPGIQQPQQSFMPGSQQQSWQQQQQYQQQYQQPQTTPPQSMAEQPPSLDEVQRGVNQGLQSPPNAQPQLQQSFMPGFPQQSWQQQQQYQQQYQQPQTTPPQGMAGQPPSLDEEQRGVNQGLQSPPNAQPQPQQSFMPGSQQQSWQQQQQYQQQYQQPQTTPPQGMAGQPPSLDEEQRGVNQGLQSPPNAQPQPQQSFMPGSQQQSWQQQQQYQQPQTTPPQGMAGQPSSLDEVQRGINQGLQSRPNAQPQQIVETQQPSHQTQELRSELQQQQQQPQTSQPTGMVSQPPSLDQTGVNTVQQPSQNTQLPSMETQRASSDRSGVESEQQQTQGTQLQTVDAQQPPLIQAGVKTQSQQTPEIQPIPAESQVVPHTESSPQKSERKEGITEETVVRQSTGPVHLQETEHQELQQKQSGHPQKDYVQSTSLESKEPVDGKMEGQGPGFQHMDSEQAELQQQQQKLHVHVQQQPVTCIVGEGGGQQSENQEQKVPQTVNAKEMTTQKKRDEESKPVHVKQEEVPPVQFGQTTAKEKNGAQPAKSLKRESAEPTTVLQNEEIKYTRVFGQMSTQGQSLTVEKDQHANNEDSCSGSDDGIKIHSLGRQPSKPEQEVSPKQSQQQQQLKQPNSNTPTSPKVTPVSQESDETVQSGELATNKDNTHGRLETAAVTENQQGNQTINQEATSEATSEAKSKGEVLSSDSDDSDSDSDEDDDESSDEDDDGEKGEEGDGEITEVKRQTSYASMSQEKLSSPVQQQQKHVVQDGSTVPELPGNHSSQGIRPNQMQQLAEVSETKQQTTNYKVEVQVALTTAPVKEKEPLTFKTEKDFFEVFQFMLACETCITKEGLGVNDYRVNVANSHYDKDCKKTVLCCRFRDDAQNWPWRVVRPKPKEIQPYLCEEIGTEKKCENPGTCPFAYTVEEYHVWLAEERGLFRGYKAVATLNEVAAAAIWKGKEEWNTDTQASTNARTPVRQEASLEPNANEEGYEVTATTEKRQSNDGANTAGINDGKDLGHKGETDAVSEGDKKEQQTENGAQRLSEENTDQRADEQEGSELNTNQVSNDGLWYKKDENEGETENKGKKKKGKKKKKRKEKDEQKTEAKKTDQGKDSKKQSKPLDLYQHLPTAGDKTMTINFCAWVSPTFGYDPKKDMVIMKSNIPAFGEWKNPCVIMKPTKTTMHDMIQIEGTLNVLPGVLRNKEMEYKYIVVQEGKMHWEHFPSHSGSIVNRKLRVPQDCLIPGGVWNRFDDVMYTKEEQNPSGWDKWKNKLKFWEKSSSFETHALESKIAVTNYMLPTWEGFCVGQNAKKGLACDAILQVKQVVHAARSHWKPYGFDVKKVLHEYLAPKIGSFKLLKLGTTQPAEVHSALVSALSILHILYHYDMLKVLDQAEIGDLFEALLIKPDIENCVCPDFDMLEHHFPTAHDKRLLVNALVGLCNGTFEYTSHIDPRFLLCLPILHFLRGDSHPFMPVNIEGKPSSLKWWGLESLQIDKFKDNLRFTKHDMMPMIKRLKPLFVVDKLLARSCIMALPTAGVCQAVRDNLIPPFEVCYRLWYTFEKISYLSQLQDIESVKDIMQVTAANIRKPLAPENGECASDKRLDEAVAVVCGACALVKIIFSKCYYLEEYEVFTCACNVYGASYALAVTLSQSGIQLENQELIETLRQVLTTARRWLTSKLPTSLMPDAYTSSYSYALRSGVTHSTYFPSELKIWHQLFSINFVDGTANDMWNDGYLDILRNRVKKLSNSDKVKLYCRNEVHGYHPTVQQVLSDAAFGAVGEIAKHKKESEDFLQSFYSSEAREAREYGGLLSRLLEKSWPHAMHGGKVTDDQILQHVMTWTPFTGFFKMTGSKKGLGCILREQAQNYVLMAKSLVENLVQKVLDGSILVYELRLIIGNASHFVDLHKVCAAEGANKSKGSAATAGDHVSSQHLIKILDGRKKELGAFERERSLVSSFLGVCDKIQPVDTKDLQMKVDTDIEYLELKCLCDPITLENGCSTPNITFFKLPQQVKEMLEPLKGVHSSILFQELWVTRAREVRRDKKNQEGTDVLTVDEIAKFVWKSSQVGITELLTNTQNGSITLRKVDILFGKFSGKYERIEKELLLLHGSKPGSEWIRKRIQQIEQYHTLERRLDAVDIVLEVRKAFSLTGNFEAVHVLSSVRCDDFKDRKLDSINEEVVHAGKVLAKLSQERIQSLKELVLRKALVEWLKEEIKTVQQLKVFVDLAMISAGETDLEVDRVKCLHQATTGYSSIIFDLEKEAGFTELMNACESLWNALRNDGTLPKKLRDIGHHFEWLKGVKESHGSVETSSLSQAEAINFCGVYTVGYMKDCNSQDTIENVIKLMVQSVGEKTVEEDEDEDDDKLNGDKVYTLDMVKDLQSKLMLVAGKAGQGRGEVERFTEILSGVTRLAAAYIKLCAAGNVLFSKWTAVIYCKPDRKVSVIVDFGVGIGDSTLSGFDPVYIQLQKLCNFMEDCLQEWLEYVEDKRSDFYQLNHYTTEQLVILRQELAKMMTNPHQVSPGVYSLLDSLKPNCKEGDVKEALNAPFTGVGSAKEELAPGDDANDAGGHEMMETDEPLQGGNLGANDTVEAPLEGEAGEPEQAQKPKFDIASIEQFISQMYDEGPGMGEDLVKASLKYLNYEADVDKAMAWCYQNSDDEELVKLLSEELDEDLESMLANETQEAAPSVPTSTVRSMQIEDETRVMSVTESTSAATVQSSDVSTLRSITTSLLSGLRSSKGDLIRKLKDLWKEYQSSLTAKSVEDYLSLEHLGYTLRYLATKDPQILDRPFPSYLNPGRPNLMVRQLSEILGTALSIYMYGPQVQLPSYDEVLICTPNTTLEEIVLLWRRAMYDTSGRIYCLVNADQLDYEVSTKAEEKRISLAKERNITNEYRLVVLCSREREDHSHMVTALDIYRIDSPSLPSIEEMQTYLKERFIQQAADVKSVQTAASLTHDKCCVQVVTSTRAGVGKSLVVTRLAEQLQLTTGRRNGVCVTVPLAEKKVDQNAIVSKLTDFITEPTNPIPRIFHFDITPAVQRGVDDFLFNMLVLGGISNVHGHIWRRNAWDLYVIEITSASQVEKTDSQSAAEKTDAKVKRVSAGSKPFFTVLPTVTCRSPKETKDLEVVKANNELDQTFENDPLMDSQEFRSAAFQRAYQYLVRKAKGANLDYFDFEEGSHEGDHVQCLEVLLRHCGIADPSWAELRHFVWFLNEQLKDCEHSVFCDHSHLEDTSLNGFLNFVVRFMMQMSKDFATPSLNMTDESTFKPRADTEEEDAGEEEEPTDGDDIAAYQLRRRWENSPHPYIFFNHDRTSMTFLGFYIDNNGNLVDPTTNLVIEKSVMTRQLKRGLDIQRVNLREDFDAQPRERKIEQLCQVMGIEWAHDPDDTYELTTDNVKKILAIHMRFRCGIPVIVMGETGCGKTRLVRFMCQLQAGIAAADGPKNMILMKVHGGTTASDIVKKVNEAERLAKLNKEKHKVDTVLFFDEANTTEAIGLIKEIMCDRRMNGKPLHHGTNALKIVAACNPYRRHTDEMIDHLEKAGLGYHIKAEQTDDKLGRIPLRQLVYRVQALPPSMLPLVWDFGQLSSEIEELYIKQIVARYVNSEKIPAGREEVISSVLAASQRFMRDRKNECSFVSLRDVERTMNVLVWFLNHEQIFELMEEAAKEEHEDDDEEDETYEPLDNLTLALVLALGVCYHACLQGERENYREQIEIYFKEPCDVPGGAEQILEEITRCQDVFLDQLRLGNNIARNAALKENVFMMVVCIELRIPLFLVGKPGSSKSLAKTIVADAMQGDAAASDLFRQFKQVHMVSYQCSPLSTPEGIVGTFRQCSRFQEGKDLDRFVSVVVLDEVGLAEDSPKMPLKTLHPLLEYGCDDDDNPPPHKKVAFIGISNWALDPAKMNRGILVSRGVPDIEELKDSAIGICSTDEIVLSRIDPMIPALAKGYLQLYKDQKKEFFGLRDFYSLVKMVYGFSKASDEPPSWPQLEHAIRRNFGGLDDQIDPVRRFDRLQNHVTRDVQRRPNDPECSAAALIRASLQGLDKEILDMDSESRYLLVLTENYAALGILQQQLLSMEDTVIIFGSSFPKDQEYTQVCRNINRIKVCMETGRTVVLLNLENLYESLYDALNQYYVFFGGQRYVDLGLGTHRVKCRVHSDFRLIVVADKEVVYERFPIPLINRLEKHFLAMTTMLTPDELTVVEELAKWVERFATIHQGLLQQRQRPSNKFKVEDAFIGFNNDTIASIVLQVCSEMNQHEADEDWRQKVFQRSQDLLLQCATPDAVARLSQSGLGNEAERLWQKYNAEQKHDSLAGYLEHQINLAKQKAKMTGVLAQVTTHSRLLSGYDQQDLAARLGFAPRVLVKNSVFLQEFQTEQQFTRKVRDFFHDSNLHQMERLLLVQCDAGNENTNLIACSRYIVQDERAQAKKQAVKEEWQPAHVVFIIQLPRVAGGCFDGLQGGKWLSVHIDELRPPHANLPQITALQNQKVSVLFESDITTDKKDEMVNVRPDVRVPLDQVEDMELAEGGASGLVLEDIHMEEIGGDEKKNAMDLEEPREAAEGNEAAEVLPCKDSQMLETQRLLETLNVGGRAQEVPSCTRSVVTEAKDVDDVPNRAALLNTSALLKNCIHAATAMLEDDEDRTQRSTERIEIVLELFKQTDPSQDTTFVSVLKERICQLLKEKDERAGDMASTWLSREAVTGERVQVHGTFRRAIWQSLVGTVTPLLAEVIAFSDRNDNLDLIKNSPPNSWVYRLWLDLLRNPNLSVLRYESFLSPVKNTPRDAVPVNSTGVNNSHFKCLCPFSSVIKNYVNDLMESALSMKGSVKMTLERLLDESELSRTLLSRMELRELEDFMRCYLSDFVRMVYRARDEEEHQVVCRAIETASLEQHIAEDYDPAQFSLDIPGIHVSYHRIHGRLDGYSQIVRLLPPHVKVWEAEQEQQMVLDAKALRALLETLTPQRDQLNDVNDRVMWLKRVQDARPIVERILDAEKQDTDGKVYGDISSVYIQQCRPLWIRICMLKLFVDHVCPPDSKVGEEIIKKTNQLSLALGEHVNLKCVKHMKVIEKVLKNCNETASRQHFRYGIHECEVCQEAIKEPVALPCEHVFCLNCIKEWFKARERICPKCKAPVDRNFRVQSSQKSREAVEAHNAFRRRCNAFFMELVSRYCFAEGEPPEPELITMLMGYVTRHAEKKERQTRGFTPFQEDCIDPNPVVRSFLLQLLLRSSVEQVFEHLQIYLDEARTFMRTDAEVLELCLLCIQCIEDSHHNHLIQTGADAKLALMIGATERLDPEIHEPEQEQAGLNVSQLDSVAGARFGLVVAAEQIYLFFGGSDQQNATQQQDHPEMFKEARRLLDMTRRFCESIRSKWPKIFLVKQLCRRYGTDSLQSVVRHPRLNWIMPPEGNVQVTFVPDRFVTCGNVYPELREAMAETLISADFKKVDKILRNRIKSNEEKQYLLLLTIYREMTMCHANKYADGSQQTPVDAHVVQKLVTYIKSSHFVTQGDFAEELIFNKQGGKCSTLTVTPDQRPLCRTVAALVIHTMIVLRCCSRYHAVQPLVTMMENPQNMANSFFPTMHEDLLLEAKAALQETVQWYECPNGHPYTIGDCGRPYGLGVCKDCGQQIGGQSHTPAAGNKIARTHDTTQTGHILGAPERRHNEIPVPERQMSPVAVAIVRMLMHASMIGAATKTPKNLVDLIHPTVNANGIPQFLWQHLEFDLHLLSRASGKSVDDSALLIHMVLHRMLTTKPQGHEQFNPLLTSKKCRHQWEDTFTRNFINPIIQNATPELQKANRLVHDDKRLGNNPLLKLLHEVDPPSQDLALDSLYNIPTVWRYRSRVTIEHLTHALQESMAAKKNKKKCRILQEFLNREHTLRALKYLPDIIQLQQLLIDRFHRNIDLHEATNLKIGKFLEGLPKGHIKDKYSRLKDSFATVWNLVRQDVFNYGGLFVPKELCDQTITKNTSLATILPTRKGDGVCSTALVDFLIITQNQFLDTYKAITKRPISDKEIKPSELTPADLIAYDPEKDLLPMVLSHCNYSLEVGRGTLVEYDLLSLERQLEERFIRSKAKIHRKIEQLVFRQDSRDAAVFETLKSKIPQEPLSKVIQHQILSELRSLPEVSDSLACLDIAIGFLASSGGKPDMPIIKYLCNILKMEREEMKVRYPCQLKHILPLWQLLAVERARRLSLNSQDPFDSLYDFREELNPEQEQNLQTALRYIDVDSLINELHHYIAIELRKEKSAEEDVANWSLRDVLVAYIDFNDHDEIANIETLPEDIRVKHCWWTWSVLIKYQRMESARY